MTVVAQMSVRQRSVCEYASHWVNHMRPLMLCRPARVYGAVRSKFGFGLVGVGFGVGLAAGATCSLKPIVVSLPFASLTVTLTWLAPALVGVPEMRPVFASIVTSAGRPVAE